MSSVIRSRDHSVYDFQDGLKVKGVDFDTAIQNAVNATTASITSSQIVSALGFTPASKSGDTFNGNVTVNGTLTASGEIKSISGDIVAYSDERLKENWSEMNADFVEALSKVKAGTFNRIGSTDGNRSCGVSAQSLKVLLPEAVKDGEFLSVSYGNAALLAAIELAKKVVMLTEEIELLKSKISK